MPDAHLKWLRKATPFEKLCEEAHQQVYYLMHCTLELTTSKPLEEFLKTALEHLFRKVPVLRLCFGTKDSELWLREMDECKIDLEESLGAYPARESFLIIQGGDIEEQQNEVTLHTYESEKGPLWRVKLLPLPKSDVSSSCNQDLIYSYALIFGTHHGLGDGETVIKTLNWLCKIIDDLMSNQSIDEREQLGDLVDEKEMLRLYEQEKERLRSDPQLYNEIKEEVERGAKVRPLLLDVCDIPSDAVVMTRSVVAVFDQLSSERFQKKAKSEGVALHSAITGLINMSLTKLLQERGITQDEYDIRGGHAINVRRYYSKPSDGARVLGVVGPLFGFRNHFSVPKDMLPVFWQTVRAFHEKFHSDIASKKALTIVAYRLMNENTNQNFDNMLTKGPNYYYTISNMRNLNEMLSEEGKCFSMSRCTWLSSLRNRSSFMGIYVHTFRGRLNINFGYSTHFLTHEFVSRLKELVSIHMKKVCES